MKRRDALRVLLALGATAGSGAAMAEAQPVVRRVGYLLASLGADFPMLHDALRQGLAELGYVDGRDVEILVRSANGVADRYPALVAELVSQNADVIFTANSSAALAAKSGAPRTPIVFAGVGDPVGLGLVQSLSRPGGNATGLALLTPELTPKRLALLREAAPGIERVAVLWNPGIHGHARELRDLDVSARTLGVRIQRVAMKGIEEIDIAYATMKGAKADGLVVLASPLHHRNMRAIGERAVQQGLPSICEFSEFAGVGGLMVYGPSWTAMYRHAAVYVAKILKGSNPATLPVEQPTRIELLVNMTTARALGLTIPQSILLRADRLIGA